MPAAMNSTFTVGDSLSIYTTCSTPPFGLFCITECLIIGNGTIPENEAGKTISRGTYPREGD